MLATMWRREDGGRLLPCASGSQDYRRIGRALDEEPRDCGGRHSRAPPGSRGRRRERSVSSKGGSKRISREERKEEKEEKEKGKEERRKGGREKGGKRKEGKEEVRRERGVFKQDQLNFHLERVSRKEKPREEVPGFGIWEDRFRPLPQEKVEVEEESEEISEESKEEERKLRQQQRGIQLQFGKHEPPVPGKQESKSDPQQDAGSTDCAIRGRNARKPVNIVRTSLECPGGVSASLSDCPPTPYVWGVGQGGINPLDAYRHGAAREDRREPRHRHSEVEGLGVDSKRFRLSSGPEIGALPVGAGRDGLSQRTERGNSRKQGGGQVAFPEPEGRRLLERRLEGEFKGLLGKEGRRQERNEERRRERRRPREELRRPRKEEVMEDGSKHGVEESLDGREWTPSPGSPLDGWCEDSKSAMMRERVQMPLVTSPLDGADDALKMSEDGLAMRDTPKVGVVGRTCCSMVEGSKSPLRDDDATSLSVAPERGGISMYRVPELSSQDLFEDEACRFGRTFGDLSLMLRDAWASFNDFGSRCKILPSGTGNTLFPLPTSLLPEHWGEVPSEEERVTVENLCRALNSMAGVEVEANGLPPTRVQCRSVEHLLQQARIACAWSEKVKELDWEDFFNIKGVDYKGDEVLVARSTGWENLRHALPDEIGRVNLVDVVSHGLVDYVKGFEDFLVPEEDRIHVRPPKVVVPPEDWEVLAMNLVKRGVCSVIGGEEVFRVQGKRLLNGLFGVSKQEFAGSVEVHRLIMNLIPLNKIVRGVDGDIATLPAWSSMSPLFLDEGQELLVSSEDVRCFFYIFRTPPEWRKFMAFNRPLPRSMWPVDGTDSAYFLCADVLPMGFKNSVSIAQNIHRNIASWAGKRGGVLSETSNELRKDRPFPQGFSLYRLYLDNFDLLEKMDSRTASLVAGRPSMETLALRAEYEEWGIPRHPKKSVVRQKLAEVQGAYVDGEKGVAFPKTEKLLRYMMLGLRFFKSRAATQKEAQVVGGGLVYVSLFRRPLLGGLNAIWRFISSFEGYPPVCRFLIPLEVKMEVIRFLSLIPLAMMNFKPNFDGRVTASDASTSGGGITVSKALTSFGKEASQGILRGDLPGMECASQVLTIGLFDGIGALRVAVDALGVMSIGHISVECSKSAQRVVESFFPEVVIVSDVADVTEEMVRAWACKFTQASLVLLGAGPPCQGVSGLNSERKGATRDRRSSLYFHLPRVRALVIKWFPWAQVHSLMESVSSMDASDRAVMAASEGSLPWHIDALGASLARRPRLYWVSWEVAEGSGVDLYPPESDSDWSGFGTINLKGEVCTSLYLTPGWSKASDEPFPTFTTSRPRDHRGPRPAGLDRCSQVEVERWEWDLHRFPPYQYREVYCLKDKNGDVRYPNVSERGLIMGFPLGYTSRCLPKSEAKTTKLVDERLTLLGNSWNVTVVVWLLGQLFGRLGLCETPSPSRCVQLTSPGGDKKLQSLLLRPCLGPPLRHRESTKADLEVQLVKKLTGLISIKGEDILLSTASDHQHRYHRLRASIPSKLWRWRTVCGWTWKGGKEHINVLELRAVLATLKWRIEKCQSFNTKFVHLTDSLVVLHALSRGRSSSRKMRRTVLRTNAYLLASNNVAVWTYVHTTLNPADKPSRRPVKRRWGK